MKIEKRTAGLTEDVLAEQNTPEEEFPPEEAAEEAAEPSRQTVCPVGRRKPVLSYILILFIAAFLLMAMSFAMHQRSNTEAMTQLQSSVNAIQETQAIQEKVIQLQEELRVAEEQLESIKTTSEEELQAQQQLLQKQEKQLTALTNLYTLQQTYAAQDLEGCRAIIDAMESAGDAAVLENITAAPEVTPPAMRYLQLKEAVEARLTAG